jgi:hypothetical protein
VLTRVVNVRGKNPDDLRADPDFIYVGRAVPSQGWAASPFGNPFKPSLDSLLYIGKRPRWTVETQRIAAHQCVVRFHACLETRSDEPWRTMRPLLRELRGKTLGCWCCDWKPEDGEPPVPCHAVVLAQLANALAPEPEQASV